ncbi:MAG: hypothetical protein AAF368_16705, partial [Planctomycetota bacterium]
ITGVEATLRSLGYADELREINLTISVSDELASCTTAIAKASSLGFLTGDISAAGIVTVQVGVGRDLVIDGTAGPRDA